MQKAKNYIDQASLSPPIPRWYSSIPKFEQAIQEVALSNQVRIRYIANFSDEARLKRVRKLLANREVNRYFVAYFSPETLPVDALNFILFDGEEFWRYVVSLSKTPLLQSVIVKLHQPLRNTLTFYGQRLRRLTEQPLSTGDR